ncbi:MAG TPA: family 78 glycoside hydrolase catalytic domain [Chitinophagaceae bacterium]|nr:family 78 glycoside hydrolase catalytic domain [Chitinophagaceae bacterium]
MKHHKLFIVMCLLMINVIGNTQVSTTNLRCEMLSNPQGIGELQPRLSWQIVSDQRNVMQQAYHILIASSKEKLMKEEGDIWNSGRVSSAQSHLIPYKGKELQSRAQCYWKVKTITTKGESKWSEPASFSLGLLNASDWKAKWIGYDKASAWDSVTQWSRLSARYFRKQFASAGSIKRATVYIVGMGLYELYINGQKIGDQVLAPIPTDYRKSVFYNTHDVTNQLKSGNNVIATVLGNGRFFTMRQDYKPQKINTFGFPKMLLQLEIEYTNGTKKLIASDETWKLNVDGPIRTNNEYDGEEYDATKELKGWNNVGYNDVKWIKPQIVAKPEGRILAQSAPPMKVMKTIQPVSIKNIGDGKYILDMGQNFSGWLQLKVKGKRGEKVKLRFAESLQPNGELYVANLRDARVTDIYTLKGEAVEIWHPSFIYHGFRYAEITGYPGTPTVNDFEGMLVFDEMKTIGSFESSNATLNTIYKNAWWGIASNYKGMPVDCPQRNERQPWLGDRATGSGGEAFLFDNASLYAKWLDDIEESQTTEGAIPDVAPAFWNYYSDNMTWPGTYMLVAELLWRQYGDDRPIIKHYPSMKKWMNYMRSKYMKDFIVTKDKYGDWCVPPESLQMIRSQDTTRTTKGELIATAYYYQLLKHLKQFAVMAGQAADTIAYNELSEKIRTAFHQKFFNKQKNFYDNNTVTANTLPLYFGLTPDNVRDAVFNNVYTRIRITDKMHISTGVIGTQWLMRMLTQFGRQDIAYTLASNTTYPSWGYMANNGATTIWELWNGNTANPQMNSQNHVMLLGDLLIWLNEQVAGIRSDNESIGFKKIIMKPVAIDELKYVNASYETPYGKVKSHWRKSVTDEFEWHINVPANATAIVYIPARTANDVSGDVAAEGVKFAGIEHGYAKYEIGSGSYTFISNPEFKKGIVKDEFIFERASFPESHAATIAETPTGLIAAWFGGTKEGNKDVCIWTSHLVNDKWSEPMKVADGVLNDSTRYACYNPVLFQVPNGELLLFYKIGPNVAGWTGWMIRSKDNGKTWSPREALPTGFLGPIKNKPLLIDGKLVCPGSTERNGWKVHFEITTDWGKTWMKTDSINDGKIVSAIQPSILTYADGRLQVLCRSKNRTINESWSTDRGKTWSAMKASSLPNNNSGTDAVTLKDGRQLLVYNHVKPAPELTNGKGARTPLNVAISKDGINWEAVLILEDSPVSQYSYPSVIQTADGMVHIVYTWRRERVKYVKIDPSKLEGKAIVNEQWPGVNGQAARDLND